MLSGRPAATIRVAPHPGRAILRAMQAPVLVVHGPPAAEVPLVLDSPHSGAAMPSDFCSVRTEAELREGEDSFIDELYRPATARGVPLLAALFPRTYLDVNRHARTAGRTLAAAARTQRQGAHRQGDHLAHDGRRPAHLRPAAERGRDAAAHRPLPPPVPRNLARPARRRACAFRRRLAPQLPFDGPEHQYGYRGRGRPAARRYRARRPRRHHLHARIHRIRARHADRPRLQRAGQRPVQGRGAGAGLVRPGARPPQPAAGGEQAPLHARQQGRATRRVCHAAGAPGLGVDPAPLPRRDAPAP